jgi:TonB-linked SusC/RagA family outer membrane protein
MPKKKIFLFILYVGMISFVNAQIQKVSGKIMNDDGTPLSGVTISVKGTKTSTQSMNDGNFTINIPEKVTKVLVFSFIGYTPKEVAIKNNLPIIVTLSSATKDLDDVVVIGYGTQRKRDLTGSVAKVNIAELQKAPVRSFEEALGGRVAGVQVTSTDGQPGSPVSIVIRGNNSITQDNSPLYVVDGFPIENPNNNAINPSDIESIEVLKDASATAIYGARAANGVIMITTKKGVAGKTKFSFNTFYGFQDILNKLDVLSPYEFVRYQFENDSTNTKSQYLTGGKTFESYRNVKGVDWQDQVFRQAPIISNSLSMSGGNAATKYFLS